MDIERRGKIVRWVVGGVLTSICGGFIANYLTYQFHEKYKISWIGFQYFAQLPDNLAYLFEYVSMGQVS